MYKKIINLILIFFISISYAQQDSDDFEVKKISDDLFQQILSEHNEQISESKEEPKPRKNLNLVIKSLEENYNINSEYNFGDDFCPNDNFCELIANKIHVQFFGITVKANTNSSATPEQYLKTCSAILSGLTDSNIELSESIVIQAFNQASQNGQTNQDFNNVNFKVKPKTNGLLECNFWKK